jgi:DNA-binding CsgD family transcriptional regulator/tetratricopeptide (TPR) repeat protein
VSPLRATNDLDRGRESFARSAWADAYESLSRADQLSPLSVDDLESLATSAYMLAREDEWIRASERAYERCAAAGEGIRASRHAFWIGMQLALRGELGRATGWLGRAQRLVERAGCDCVEQGYLLLPVVFQHEAAGDLAGAAATAASAAEIGERFGDRDLYALAVHAQGVALVHDGRLREGLALMDEAMLAVTTGELSPPVTGIVYCSVILTCEEIHELRRAQEWTAALTQWCEGQPQLGAFTGRCRVHRARLMQLHGAWTDALAEASGAGERPAQSMNKTAAAAGRYLEGELHRLQGEHAQAEAAYREASRLGFEPQPGLSLLRLAQGERDAGAAAIRRVLSETGDEFRRASLLPAYVELMLAVGDVEGARKGSHELDRIAAEYGTEMLAAMGSSTHGAVELAEGDAVRALVSLREGCRGWQTLQAPYETARTRVMVAQACRTLGDDDGFALELEAARAAFEELGATPDVERVDALAARDRPAVHGLTPRELEVLRLVATGKSNREIAKALVISEHTAARHVQNILAKLDVTTRTAAGAFAFEHDLV